VTGMVTGLLTLGSLASPFVMRFVLASVAFAFIMIRQARVTRARDAAVAGHANPSASGGKADPAVPAGNVRPEAHSKRHVSRQRRGGRKR
jgi:hypothetical protein